MAIERWIQGPALPYTGNLRTDMNVASANAGVLVEVTLASGTAGNSIKITHNLGRVPRGMRIVNVVTASNPTHFGWYRDDGDAAWDNNDIEARFLLDDCDLMLEVF